MSDRPTGAPQLPADAAPPDLGPETMISSVERGLGAVVERAAPGWVGIGVELVPGLLDPAGQPSMALLCCLADFAIGTSVCTGFVPPRAASTLELRIDRADGLTAGARRIAIEGRVSSVHDTNGFGVATFTDDAGVVVARAVATMAMRSGPPPTSTALRPADTGRPADTEHTERPADTMRPADTGRPADTKRPDRPADAGRSTAAPPVAEWDPVALDRHIAWDGADPSEAVVPVDATMANPFGQVHGGVLMAIAERAQRRLHPPGAALLTATIEYLRPAPVADGSVHCTSTVIRNGRRFSTVRTEMLRLDGKVAAVATGITAVGRSAP